MARLTPCPSCTRHVKVGSASCPFCGGDVPMRGVPAAYGVMAAPEGGAPLYGAAANPDADTH